MFSFLNLDRFPSSLSQSDPTHLLLSPPGAEIVRGINGESGGRKESEQTGENMLE